MKRIMSYPVQIFCGLREGYTDRVHDHYEAERICQDYCDTLGLCVTVTPTTFVYKDGHEPGVIVGLIQYPRFPCTEDAIIRKATDLAKVLKHKFKQLRLTVQTPQYTFMIEDEDGCSTGIGKDEFEAVGGLKSR